MMEWSETIRTAIAALNARRMRSLLTMLGILIGISAVASSMRAMFHGPGVQVVAEVPATGPVPPPIMVVMPLLRAA